MKSTCLNLFQLRTLIVGKCQGPAQDEVIAKLRHAFLEIATEYKTYTDQEKNKVGKNLISQLQVLYANWISFSYLL